MKILLLAAVLAASNFHLTCAEVRAYVAEHGRVQALAFALRSGATWRQIREARACLSK